MADDKTNVGEPDRSKVSAGEEYEIGYLASKHSLTLDQARDLIAKHGNNRDELDEEAKKLKSV